MQQRHWTDDDLLARLYEVGPQDGHLESCVVCADRWQQLLRRRKALKEGEPEIPQELLAEQRRSVLARLERPQHTVAGRWVPLFATALLLLMAITLWRPGTAPEVVSEVSDAQVFEQIFTRVSTTEPQAVEPLRALFEVSK